jgi:hypothetical protein
MARSPPASWSAAIPPTRDTSSASGLTRACCCDACPRASRRGGCRGPAYRLCRPGGVPPHMLCAGLRKVEAALAARAITSGLKLRWAAAILPHAWPLTAWSLPAARTTTRPPLALASLSSASPGMTSGAHGVVGGALVWQAGWTIQALLAWHVPVDRAGWVLRPPALPSCRELYARFYDAFEAWGEPNIPVDRQLMQVGGSLPHVARVGGATACAQWQGHAPPSLLACGPAQAS